MRQDAALASSLYVVKPLRDRSHASKEEPKQTPKTRATHVTGVLAVTSHSTQSSANNRNQIYIYRRRSDGTKSSKNQQSN